MVTNTCLKQDDGVLLWPQMCVVRAWRWMCNIMHVTGDVQMELVDVLSVRSALPGQAAFVFLVAQQTCHIC